MATLLGSPVTIVHHLDRETSGVTVLARNAEAAKALSEAFRVGAAEKTYVALCARAPTPPEGRIDAPLGPDPARQGRRAVRPDGAAAATRYRTLRTGATGAWVEALPETGTNPIKSGFTSPHLGAPLLGDARYGSPTRSAPLPSPE